MDRDLASSVWAQFLGKIETEISHPAFVTWFECIEPEFRDDSFILFVPTEFHKLILETRYLELIRNSIVLAYPKYDSHCKTENDSFTIAVRKSNSIKAQLQSRKALLIPFTMKLNPNFTYQNYITGKCNNAVVQATRDIADHLSSKHNPLYIYGGVGTGKTHLLQAMASHILANGQSEKVLYLKAEDFICEMIRQLKEDRQSDFIDCLESLDVLIIDDLQITEGKVRTLEEICTVFSQLINRGVHIVVASVDPPEKVGTVCGRLALLLEQGKTAELKEHDAMVKRGILKLHANKKGITLSDDVIEFLTQKNKYEIREMLCLTNKIAMTSRLSGQDIRISAVKQMLT